LEFRVSLDGFTPESNDPIRGTGTFGRILRGIRRLVDHGFLPIITVTRTEDDQDDGSLVQGFVHLLREQGYDRPRLKILPTLRIGAEAGRQRGYHVDEFVTVEMMAGFDHSRLVCNHARMVTDQGVWVCPILIDAADARLGGSLGEATIAFPLGHQACYTCYQFGNICSNG
jgi:hypothetical protein